MTQRLFHTNTRTHIHISRCWTSNEPKSCQTRDRCQSRSMTVSTLNTNSIHITSQSLNLTTNKHVFFLYLVAVFTAYAVVTANLAWHLYIKNSNSWFWNKQKNDSNRTHSWSRTHWVRWSNARTRNQTIPAVVALLALADLAVRIRIGVYHALEREKRGESVTFTLLSKLKQTHLTTLTPGLIVSMSLHMSGQFILHRRPPQLSLQTHLPWKSNHFIWFCSPIIFYFPFVSFWYLPFL